MCSQVENEYGSFACDTQYMSRLRDIMKEKIGTKALLYTTNGANDVMLSCGSVPNVYTTIDFGTSTDVKKTFETLRVYQSRVNIDR